MPTKRQQEILLDNAEIRDWRHLGAWWEAQGDGVHRSRQVEICSNEFHQVFS